MEAGRPIRILLADDHELFSEALSALLLERWRGAKLRRVSTFFDLIRVLEHEGEFDLVITDLRMPELISASQIANIVETSGDAKLILLSGDAQEVDIPQALADGASGFVHKGQPGVDLISAIEAVLKPLQRDAQALQNEHEPKALAPHFSRREFQTLTLLFGDRSNEQIASELGVSPATVKVYIKSLLRKAGVSTRTALAVFGLQNNPGGDLRRYD